MNSILFLQISSVILVIIFLILVHHMLHPSLGSAIRNSNWMPAEKFLRMRNVRNDKNRLASEKYNVKGVYILHNISRHKYYVGQAHKLLSRVNGHLTGKGNGDVYADYIYGDKFRVRFVRFRGRAFKSLNEMERYYIDKYHAQNAGYNKTVGNK